ncbi:hypothetical protein VHUM_02228 [Vanrija humicola]|uniref:Uncharacterized protein n=1 Tax=Vanrija humicola TaxID=5417 RepID=A0A7D8Z6A7_VANHU|nr:hypothetical protein VHUM_02228 [Vanrija humicola]
MCLNAVPIFRCAGDGPLERVPFGTTALSTTQLALIGWVTATGLECPAWERGRSSTHSRRAGLIR